MRTQYPRYSRSLFPVLLSPWITWKTLMSCIVALTWDKSYRNGEFQIGHLMCLCFIKTTGRGVRPSGNIASIPSNLLTILNYGLTRLSPKSREHFPRLSSMRFERMGNSLFHPPGNMNFCSLVPVLPIVNCGDTYSGEREEQTRSSCLTSEVGK